MQNEGKIKHIGLSNVSKEQLIRAQQVAPIAAVQNAFSYQDRHYAVVVDYAGQEEIAFVTHTPVVHNNWTPERKHGKRPIKLDCRTPNLVHCYSK